MHQRIFSRKGSFPRPSGRDHRDRGFRHARGENTASECFAKVSTSHPTLSLIQNARHSFCDPPGLLWCLRVKHNVAALLLNLFRIHAGHLQESEGELQESAGDPIEKVSENREHVIFEFEDLLE
jgi:hypothetical protein